MPKVREFIPITPEDLAGIIRKRERKAEKLRAQARRRQNGVACEHLTKLHVNDEATSRSACGVCGKPIRFDVMPGERGIVRFNPDGTRHAHQDESGDRTLTATQITDTRHLESEREGEPRRKHRKAGPAHGVRGTERP